MRKVHVIELLAAILAVLAVAHPAIAIEWPTYAGGPRRLFFNPAETQITAANVGDLSIKWRFPTGAIITGSPSVVTLDIPGEGQISIAFIQSWDYNVYAVRVRNGTELWRFTTDVQPGASYPNVGAVHVSDIDGVPAVFAGAGQTMYSLDAVTGTENWRFNTGTGCVDPPGLCGYSGERNEVESSPIVADDKVIFGMDVNDVEGGKGGVYAVDTRDGRLEWFFDLETGATCTPFPADDIRRFDGYHTESELGLPVGFLATRPGCAFDRTATGCGNVWSSPALDTDRSAIFIGSSNCDTDNDPGTLRPPPPMPPYDAAVFSLDLDGNPRWVWRPREVDNDDLAFGAVPNLFTIEVDDGGSPVMRDVVGIGQKDGTYYVIDRDGSNITNGTVWDDVDPSTLPYWATQVVPGGAIGGVIATAAVDEAREQIYFSTGPGFDPLNPQRPTVHALNMHTGAILWQNTAEPNADASYAPTSAIPGAVFAGSVIGGKLRSYDPDTGVKLGSVDVGFALAAGPAVVDGTVLVGGGIGERGPNPNSPSVIVSWLPHDLTALCVPGTPACQRVAPFACYKSRSAAGSTLPGSIPSVDLIDRFGSQTVDIKRAVQVCNPADKDGADPATPTDPDHLKVYKAKRSGGQPKFTAVPGIEVTDMFGTMTLTAKAAKELLVPSALSQVDDPPALPEEDYIDHFRCYSVKRAAGAPKFERVRDVALVDELGGLDVDVTRPKRLCVPVDKNGESPGAGSHPDHLMCYSMKRARGAAKFASTGPLHLNDQFGPESVDAIRPQTLCVPAVVDIPGATTTTTNSTTSTTITPTSTTTSTTLQFTWAEVQTILDTNCSNCHGNGQSQGGLGDLDDFDAAYANMVDVPSTQASLDIIEPFDSSSSYLMHKLDGTHLLVGGSGGQMPPTGSPLSAFDRNGIRAWINAGAAKFGSPSAAFMDVHADLLD
jgi:outer membrane protein assembly factor BamB/mono/diheme cytochrome c family protein